MKKSIQILRLVLVLAITSFAFSSCVDKDYDDIVTANVDPNLTATHTIKQLQALAVSSVGKEITTDVIVAGVVVGDDSSGNIYKKIILQQDSSGIAISVDVSNFYTEYPVGRKVFVKCKGLFIANNSGNIELGASATNPVGRIPASLVSKYLVKGKWGQYITPAVYALDDPNIPPYTLIKFNDVEFTDADAGVAYAATSGSNLYFESCDSTIPPQILYSSNYSTFALTKTPTGKGSITGVYSLYGGAGELQIRGLKDVQMTGVRCDGSTGNLVLMPLDSIRFQDNGDTTYLPTDKKIIVTVTSNYSTAMVTSKNAYVQDGTAGMLIRFDATHTFAVGTLLEIKVSGNELSTYTGVLQINKIPLGNASVIGTGSVTPRIATIADINANFADTINIDTWEGQLVKINNVTITGTGTYNGTSGANTLNDGTGSLTLYTASSATFKSDPYPTGTVSVTGILTEYNGTIEILIRDVNDVQ